MHRRILATNNTATVNGKHVKFSMLRANMYRTYSVLPYSDPSLLRHASDLTTVYFRNVAL